MGAPEVQTISHLSRKKSFWGESGETFIKKPPQTRFSQKGVEEKAAAEKDSFSASCGKRHKQGSGEQMFRFHGGFLSQNV